jgi:hypothetical protein
MITLCLRVLSCRQYDPFTPWIPIFQEQKVPKVAVSRRAKLANLLGLGPRSPAERRTGSYPTSAGILARFDPYIET